MEWMTEQPGKSDQRSATANWKPLVLLNLYRLLVAGLLMAVANMGPGFSVLGVHDSHLFFILSGSYLAFGLVAAFTLFWRAPTMPVQLYVHILTDIIIITLLMHLSGGVRSGLGMLLIVTIASGSIIMRGRIAALIAAISALAILGETFYAEAQNISQDQSYLQAGLLGATYFITAIIANMLAKRARESEALAAKRGVDLANMQQLTQYVIQRMQTGVVVIDSDGKIRLINESAWLLLGNPSAPTETTLTAIAPALADQLHSWQNNADHEPRIFRATENTAEILPRFARLGTETTSGTLIFLEDTAAMAQQAQQMKLASLGRLTAGIAHEIRNPLGAISHANQLLAESPTLDSGDARLTQIIRDNSQRMNTIIENILQLSRRRQSQPESFDIKPWLEEFAEEFCQVMEIPSAAISIDIQPATTQVRIDPTHLHQILWNLCDNGLRYSRAKTGAAKLELHGGISKDAHTPYLDIIDFGAGIDTKNAAHIFEPFFTTEAKGTGLGLYISRELCVSNKARLNYVARPGQGGRFRITFADPRRKQVA